MSEAVHRNRPNAAEYSEIRSARKLLNNEIITIYHGNKVENMVPTYGFGGTNNDYGRGFYTTPSIELAKEWAWGTYTAGNLKEMLIDYKTGHEMRRHIMKR